MSLPAPLAEVVSDFAEVQGQDKLSLLLEFAIQAARINDKRKARREALEVPEDEAAPIPTVEPVERPAPVAGASRIDIDDDAT